MDLIKRTELQVMGKTDATEQNSSQVENNYAKYLNCCACQGQ